MSGDRREPPDPPAPMEPAEPREPIEWPVESAEPPAPPREPRPIIERIGLAAVALVLAILFGGVAAASWIGGELFLAVMGGVGCLMTIWVGALTLFRG